MHHVKHLVTGESYFRVRQDELLDLVNDGIKPVAGATHVETFSYFGIHTHRFVWRWRSSRRTRRAYAAAGRGHKVQEVTSRVICCESWLITLSRMYRPSWGWKHRPCPAAMLPCHGALPSPPYCASAQVR